MSSRISIMVFGRHFLVFHFLLKQLYKSNTANCPHQKFIMKLSSVSCKWASPSFHCSQFLHLESFIFLSSYGSVISSVVRTPSFPRVIVSCVAAQWNKHLKVQESCYTVHLFKPEFRAVCLVDCNI